VGETKGWLGGDNVRLLGALSPLFLPLFVWSFFLVFLSSFLVSSFSLWFSLSSLSLSLLVSVMYLLLSSLSFFCLCLVLLCLPVLSLSVLFLFFCVFVWFFGPLVFPWYPLFVRPGILPRPYVCSVHSLVFSLFARLCFSWVFLFVGLFPRPCV